MLPRVPTDFQNYFSVYNHILMSQHVPTLSLT